MTITDTIPGATLLDQLNEPTMDGQPDENANDNCVATSIAEALHILTGKTYDGDELKDATYGQGYVGFQSAARYVAYCANQGVTLAPVNADQAGLVAIIHREVAAGHPVIVTMPSQWGTAPADPVHPSGTTHVGVAVGIGPGEIRVMNPWHGFYQDQSDAWWQARLCEGQVWPLQKASGQQMNVIPPGWKDDGTTLTAPNGVAVVRGFREWVLAHPWNPDDAPLAAEAGTDPDPVEVGNPAGGAGSRQLFKISGQLSWTPARGVFATWQGQEIAALHTALTAAQSAQSQAQSQTQAGSATIGQQTAQIAALQARVAALQAQVAQLEAAAAAPAPAPAPAPTAPAAPTTPADAAALLVQLVYAEAEKTLKAVS